MLLAQQLAGFSPGDSDKMRKTLVKKDLTSLGKKAKEKEELEKKFVEGCVSVSGLERRKAQELFDKIAFFSLYGFNLSHAVSYAIVSYYGAWLSTYYPKHWLSTVLQAESGSQEKLTKVINEIRKMGYEFAQIDVNYSEKEWAFSDDIDAFVPSLASVKGIGATAVDEILSLRPFASIDDFLYDEGGKWRLSKINKTCLSALCKIEALSSLKDFEQSDINYNQLLHTFTDENNYVLLKKGRYGKTATQLKKSAKEEIEPEPIVDVLLQKYANLEDWTRAQKTNLQFELTSSVDPELLFSSKLMNRLGEKNVSSLHKIQSGTAGIGWFCVQDVIQKKTKNGKTFYRIRAIDDEHNATWLRVWGKFENNVPPERFSLWMAHASNDSNWGFSTSVAKLRRIA